MYGKYNDPGWVHVLVFMVVGFENATWGPAPLNPIPNPESLEQELRRASWGNGQRKGSSVPCGKWFASSPPALTTLY